MPVSDKRRDELKALAMAKAIQYGIEPGYFLALIETESGWDENAVSPDGARGLAQLMPDAAEQPGVGKKGDYDLMFDPVKNLDSAAKYIHWQSKRPGIDPKNPLIMSAAYNAGAGAVDKHGGVPPYRETVNYTRKIRSRWKGGVFTPKKGATRRPKPEEFDIDPIVYDQLADIVPLAPTEDALGTMLANTRPIRKFDVGAGDSKLTFEDAITVVADAPRMAKMDVGAGPVPRAQEPGVPYTESTDVIGQAPQIAKMIVDAGLPPIAMEDSIDVTAQAPRMAKFDVDAGRPLPHYEESISVTAPAPRMAKYDIDVGMPTMGEAPKQLLPHDPTQVAAIQTLPHDGTPATKRFLDSRWGDPASGWLPPDGRTSAQGQVAGYSPPGGAPMPVPAAYRPRRFTGGPALPRRPGPYGVAPVTSEQQRYIRNQGLISLGAGLLGGINAGVPGGYDFSAMGTAVAGTQQVMQGLSDQITERNTQAAIWDYQVLKDEETKRRQQKVEARAQATHERAMATPTTAEQHVLDRDRDIQRIEDYVKGEVEAKRMTSEEGEGYIRNAVIDPKKTHTDMMSDADRKSTSQGAGTLTERNRIEKIALVESFILSPRFRNLPDSDSRKQKMLDDYELIRQGSGVMADEAFDYMNDINVWPSIGRGSMEDHSVLPPALASMQNKAISDAGASARHSVLRNALYPLWSEANPKGLDEDFDKGFDGILATFIEHPDIVKAQAESHMKASEAGRAAYDAYRQNNSDTRIASSARGQAIRGSLGYDPQGFLNVTAYIHEGLAKGEDGNKELKHTAAQLFAQKAPEILAGVPPEAHAMLLQLVSPEQAEAQGIQPDLSILPPELFAPYQALQDMRGDIVLQLNLLRDEIRGNRYEPLYP